MKKFIGFVMFIIPVGIVVCEYVPKIFNGGAITVASILSAIVIGAIYLLLPFGLYDSED